MWRCRVLPSVFLAVNVVVGFISGLYLASRDESTTPGWAAHFNLHRDLTLAGVYATSLWVMVAMVALWQLRDPPLTHRRWWRAGWFSCAMLAAAVAIDDALAVKDVLDEHSHWLWIAVLIPLASPLLVCVALTFWRITGQCAALRSLLWASGLLTVMAILSDGSYFDLGEHRPWLRLVEEGSELLVSAILLVVMTTWRTAESPKHARPAAFLSLLVLVWLVPLAAIWEVDLGRAPRHPTGYVGPLGTVAQEVRVKRDFLSSIKVAAHVDVGDAADLTLRVRGPGGVYRESQAVVTAAPWSNQEVEFQFEPIVDSRDKTYDLELTRAGESPPYAFVGISGNSDRPARVVRINGEPTPYDELAVGGLYALRRGLWVVSNGVRSDALFAANAFAVVAGISLWLWSVWVSAGLRQRANARSGPAAKVL